MFFYAFIIFLSAPLPSVRSDFPCKTKADCLQHIYYIVECIFGFCQYFKPLKHSV
ncbi:Nodule Cysteine-Rich (NCR) secreted peptide [Medicago truncatula]|uniref:Nodule Cysteine-Rich (NCR) secreted peptide n=2 Tax=Medicago truncatula TaxID=3880 RepID=A0A072U2G2_MEDTR|nr:Nodule Cysteine-Rich (NCR) secreted peptide [Medicago truncatula]